NKYNNYFVERTLSYFLIKSFYDFIFCTMCQKGGGQYGESWRKKQWNLMQDWVNLVTRYCGI
nr:hypothetical protein [Phocaeicola sp.]